MKSRFLSTLIAGTLLLAMQTGIAAESGFLSDYSQLETRPTGLVGRVYIKPGAADALAAYNAVMIDQPEVFLADDTKYAGAKPDHLKQLSDTLRQAMIDRMSAGGYNTVDEPGPGVIYMRWAVTDLYLKKKRRNFLAYTPVGMVVHTTAQLAIQDLWKKIDIVELNLEIEFLDAQNGEVLAAAVLERGHRKDKKKKQKQELVSWEDLDAVMRTFGERVRCNLDNAKLEESAREDCTQILIESAKS